MRTIIASCLALIATVFVDTGIRSVEAQVQLKGAPRGDYAQSCSGAYVNLGRLYADCQDRRGQMRSTSIELARCSDNNIRNDNGLLVCGRHRGDFERQGGGVPGAGYPTPAQPGYPGHPGHPGQPGHPGSGWGSSNGILVFEHADFRGRSLEIQGPIRNLKDAGMNDRISSVMVRGSWEVCTDANFRGRCVIIDRDVANLKALQVNDAISSIRPYSTRRRR